jgi:hypothetical protein
MLREVMDLNLDASIILGVLLINALLGFIQEGRAEKDLDSIRHMLSAEARTVRDDETPLVPAEELVPGDVVLLDSGDKVPPDLRLTDVKNLRTEEAALTGESVPTDKSTAPVSAKATVGDRESMAFSGTLVVSGRATGVVVGTGSDTELGRINRMLQSVSALLKACVARPEMGGPIAYTATPLRKTGRFAEAREILGHWLDRGKKDDSSRAGVEGALKKLERAAAAEAKVAAVLAGQDPAADNAEHLLLAQRCFCLRHEAAAARLYAAAFAADTALAAFTYRMPTNDVFIAPRETSNRYNAALAAARAGCRASDDAR